MRDGPGQVLEDGSVDESIQRANAFQLAEFRYVIGTLRNVDDELCVDMAKMTYGLACFGGNLLASLSREPNRMYKTEVEPAR